MPRYSGWSFETTSARRHAATMGTCSSSAKRSSSVDVRARSTPPPARMTGRSAEASSSMTARTSSSVGPGGAGARAFDVGALGRDAASRRSSARERRTGPGRPPRAWRIASPRAGATASASWRLRGPLGEAADRRDLVDLLERLVAAVGSLDLADDREHRRRILAGRVDPDREVGGPDRARAETHRGPPGQLGMRLGHERRRALVARRDDADAGIAERIEQAQERFPRDRERDADPGAAKGIGDESTDGPRPIIGRGRCLGLRLPRRARRRPRRVRPPARANRRRPDVPLRHAGGSTSASVAGSRASGSANDPASGTNVVSDSSGESVVAVVAAGSRGSVTRRLRDPAMLRTRSGSRWRTGRDP